MFKYNGFVLVLRKSFEFNVVDEIVTRTKGVNKDVYMILTLKLCIPGIIYLTSNMNYYSKGNGY